MPHPRVPDRPVVDTKEAQAKAGGKAPLSPFAERAGYIIFILVALGLTFAKQIGLANWQVTVIGAMLMVLCGVLKPKEATGALPISVLLLIVGALGMADALAATGAGDLIGSYMAGLYGAVNGNSYMMDYGGYDQPTMFKMSWRPAILFTVVAVAWTMTLFPIL